MSISNLLRSAPFAFFFLVGLAASSPQALSATTSEQAARIEVGQEAPAFSLSSSDRATYNLNDLRGEKNLVLIFFRGSW